MKRTTKKSGFVYFIHARETALVKIGYTTNVKNRLSTLQTSSAHRLDTITTAPGDLGLEAELHHLFRRYRREGEWFEFPECLINRASEGAEQKKTKPPKRRASRGIINFFLSLLQSDCIELRESGVQMQLHSAVVEGKPSLRLTLVDVVFCPRCRTFQSAKDEHACPLTPRERITGKTEAAK
jgi:hypothetical protein